GQYADAAAAFQSILSEYPDTPSAAGAYYRIGQCQEKLQDRAAAMNSYRRQWQTYPKAIASADALLAMGQNAYEQREYAQAVEHLQTLLKTFPQYEKRGAAEYQVGMSYLNSGDPAKAQSYFESLSKADAEEASRARALLGLARVHFQQNRNEEAKTSLQQTLEIADKDVGAEALILLGDTHRRQNQLSEAIVAYLKVKYLYPGESAWIAAGLFQAGQCYEEQNKIGDARRCYQTILNEYPAEKAYVSRAQARLQALVGR
ncbi:tetratricopeptide repeat protein, partial [bacterium]|nr:tetratricopeptide repeat protein [bacterium]